MASLEDQLKQVHQEETRILQKIDERNKKKTIKCSGCDEFHQIGTLKAIQTHWYTQPFGCTGGDYWNIGELQFVCPETGIINRLLFDNYDVPWEERRKYENNPEEQFRTNYKKLFKEVVDTHGDKIQGKWVNNFYVDQHRKEFGIVEKRKDNVRNDPAKFLKDKFGV